jgi:hypothetical protein
MVFKYLFVRLLADLHKGKPTALVLCRRSTRSMGLSQLRDGRRELDGVNRGGQKALHPMWLIEDAGCEPAFSIACPRRFRSRFANSAGAQRETGTTRRPAASRSAGSGVTSRRRPVERQGQAVSQGRHQPARITSDVRFLWAELGNHEER